MKAKSRLSKKKSARPSFSVSQAPRSRRTSQLDNNASSRSLWLLIVTGVSYISLGYLLTQVQPSQVANFPLYQLFLPFQVLLLVGNATFLTFILASWRHGLIIATTLQLLILLHLQAVIINWQLMVIIICGAILIDIALSLSRRNS